jgi:hypothetical protein
MPKGHSPKVAERLESILALVSDGCKTSSLIQQRLGLSHGVAKMYIYMLEKEGRIKRVIFGRVALVCTDMDQYRQLLSAMIKEVERLVTTNNLRYITPLKLYKLIASDPQARKFFSKIIPIPPISPTLFTLRFLNHLLRLIYGEPYVKTDKFVYLAHKASPNK